MNVVFVSTWARFETEARSKRWRMASHCVGRGLATEFSFSLSKKGRHRSKDALASDGIVSWPMHPKCCGLWQHRLALGRSLSVDSWDSGRRAHIRSDILVGAG